SSLFPLQPPKSLIFESFSLSPAHASQLINLCNLSPQNEDRRRVVHPDHNDHDRRDGPLIDRTRIERLHVRTEQSLRKLEHEARKERSDKRRLPSDVVIRKKLVQRIEHQRDENERDPLTNVVLQ